MFVCSRCVSVIDPVLLRWGIYRPVEARRVKRLHIRVPGGLRASVRGVQRHERVLLLLVSSRRVACVSCLEVVLAVVPRYLLYRVDKGNAPPPPRRITPTTYSS